MRKNFYDKVARRFGGYGYGDGRKPVYKKYYPNEDPEKIFKEKLLSLSDRSKVVLDIGCADGKFTESIAPYFKKIFGIDNSKVNLDIAIANANNNNQNVEYSLQDASRTSFKNSFFDLVYCRRGPSFYDEYYRIIKPKGNYLEIGIGEKDAVDLKKIFGRGQDFGESNKSRLDKDLKILNKLGFKTIFSGNYYYFDYYPNYNEIELFLQQVPIFEDFDKKKDRKYLEKYVRKFTTNKGIQLSRHRLVLLVQKPD